MMERLKYAGNKATYKMIKSQLNATPESPPGESVIESILTQL